jgi:hypothetical protein
MDPAQYQERSHFEPLGARLEGLRLSEDRLVLEED